MLAKTQTFWRESWKQHFAEYLSYTPFQAYYLYCLLERSDTQLLEIAGGSFHDTSCLNEWGISCTGIDLCADVVQMARYKNRYLRHKVFVMDAKNMDFKDKSFDVSFHNGFFVNFTDDDEIRGLLQEQVRVTKRLIVCSVHNQLNNHLIEKFENFSAVDDLYNIRFYTPEKLKELLRLFCREVKILPLQTPEFDQMIVTTQARDFVKAIYSRYYHAIDLTCCKRLMAVGFL